MTFSFLIVKGSWGLLSCLFVPAATCVCASTRLSTYCTDADTQTMHKYTCIQPHQSTETVVPLLEAINAPPAISSLWTALKADPEAALQVIWVRARLQTHRCLHFHNSRTYLRVPWALALWACPGKMPRHTLGKFHRGLCPVGGTTEEECEESFLWGGRSGRDSMRWTDPTTAPIPCTPVPWGKGSKEIGNEVMPGKKGGVGGSCTSHYLSLILLAIK